MRVSQRLDYALRAIVLLAQQPQGVLVAAGDLAERLSLPRRFVEQQVSAMAGAGLVTCRRGASGGCALARPASAISVLEVVEAIQGDVLDVPRASGSAASELWADAAGELSAFLGTVSVAQLAERQRELDHAVVPMYWI